MSNERIVIISTISIFILGFLFLILYLTGVLPKSDSNPETKPQYSVKQSQYNKHENTQYNKHENTFNFQTKYPSFYEGSLFLLNPVYDGTMRYRSLEDTDNLLSYTSWGAPDCRGVQETQIRQIIQSFVRAGKFNPSNDVIIKSIHFIMHNGYWPILNQLSPADQISALKQIFDHISGNKPQPTPQPIPPPTPQPSPTPGPNPKDVSNLINQIVKFNGLNVTIGQIECAINFFVKTPDAWAGLVRKLDLKSQGDALNQIVFQQYCIKPVPGPRPGPRPGPKPNISGTTWTDVNKRNLRDWIVNEFKRDKLDSPKFIDCFCDSLENKYNPDQFVTSLNGMSDDAKMWFLSTVEKCGGGKFKP